MKTRYTCCGMRYLSHFSTTPAETLTFWGQVTSSVTWPTHSQYAVFYWWSIVTIVRLSCMVTTIWSLKYFGVTTLAFWCHRTSSVTWPFDSQYAVSYRWSITTIHLSCTVRIYGASHILRSQPWRFGVTWHHRSHDHWTRDIWLPISDSLKPRLYLA